jgi:hypothetical protein
VDGTLKEDLAVKAGVNVKYDSKPWTVTANVDVAYDQSKTEATRAASEQARDVVQRATTKVTDKVSQQRPERPVGGRARLPVSTRTVRRRWTRWAPSSPAKASPARMWIAVPVRASIATTATANVVMRPRWTHQRRLPYRSVGLTSVAAMAAP